MIETVFLSIGVIIFIGFFSMIFFERTRIPDMLILMLVGLTLGYILEENQIAIFEKMAPYVGALALMMILFDGGLNFDLLKVVRELGEASMFTLTAFLMSCLFVMNIMHFIFGWNFLEGLLLGAVIGGTSSAIVITTISRILVDERVKIILSLESAITDALCIVVSLAVIEIMMLNEINVRNSLGDLFGAFSISVVSAVLISVLWMGILKKFRGKSFGYLLTVAVIFIMYSLVEFVKGNGAIAVFVFGLVLGNARYFWKTLKLEGILGVDATIKSFQKETAFFIRTFFFVYLGLIFNKNALNYSTISISLAVLAAILAARIISVGILTLKNKSMRNYRIVLTTMLPRGLAAAVLASIPLERGINIESFPEIVFLIIILTSITATIGTFVYERKIRQEKVENKSHDHQEIRLIGELNKSG